jgi:predicted membrane protein
MTTPFRDPNTAWPPEGQTAAPPPRPRFTPQALFGLIVIVVGVLFTLDNLSVLDASDYLQYWPAGLVAVGLLKLWQVRAGQGVVGGLFLVGLGSWMLLERIVAIQIRLHDVWPLFFVCLGGYMVWKGFRGPRFPRRLDSNERVNAVAVMSGVVRNNSSQKFEGGELTAILGGCEVDLRQASISGEATIDLFAFWGGIEIRVPEDWTIDPRVTPVMGGFEDKTRRSTQPAPPKRLVLRGMAMMGGIVVKN